MVLGPGQRLTVAADAIGVALSGLTAVSAGPRSIIVVAAALSDPMGVCLGADAMIVVQYFEPMDEARRFTLTSAGNGGLEPDVPYVLADGVFHKRSEYIARQSGTPRQASMPRPPAWPFTAGDITRIGLNGVVQAEGSGWAIAESDAAATAGTGGLAMADEASAGDFGIAVTGGGTARVGHSGIAVCDAKRYGKAVAGPGGVAVGLGSRYGEITAGDIGAAIYGGSFGIVTAGDGGVAIGGYKSNVRVGRDGVAIASQKCPLGEAGSLLVCRGPEGQFRSAVVEADGTIPLAFMQWATQFGRQSAAERAAIEASVWAASDNGSASE